MEEYDTERPIRVEDADADWASRLARVPSLFGRLVFLASRRDAHTGLYRDAALASSIGTDESHQLLARFHRGCFREWLRFTLEQQQADLELYLAGLTTDRLGVVRTWLRLKTYRNLAPADGEDVDLDLFEVDVVTLLELLKCRWERGRQAG